MFTLIFKRFILTLAATGLLMLGAQAQQKFTPDQKSAIEAMIKDYLMSNPEVIQDALAELEKRQKDKERVARLSVTQDKAGLLFTSQHQMVFGNPNGDVTLVEFFDYNCGYCKRALGDKLKLIETDKNLRVIVKEFPVLGQASVEAAQVALAVKDQLKPEKQLEFHTKLMQARGTINRDKALEIAAGAGANLEKLRREMDSPAVLAGIRESVGIADQLGLTGTPSYVIGEEIIVGAVGYGELKSRIDNVRKCGKTSC